jgi:hypothetical protein
MCRVFHLIVGLKCYQMVYIYAPLNKKIINPKASRTLLIVCIYCCLCLFSDFFFNYR